MANYTLTETFQSIRFTDWMVERYEIASQNSEKIFVPVLNGAINKSEYDFFIKFLKAIGCTQVPNNYGTASFNLDGSFIRHSPCYFGNYEDAEGELKTGLIVGTKLENNEPLYIEVVCKETDDSEQPYKYYLGNRELQLKESIDENKKPSGKLYLQLSVGRDDYSIACIFNKDYNADEVYQNFVTGEFHHSLRNFSSKGNGRVYGEANKLFNKHLMPEKMPNGGIVLLLKAGVMKESVVNDKLLISSTWEIVSSNFPELLVETYRKANPTDAAKSATLHTLSDITHITFSQNSQPTQYFIDKGLIKHDGYAICKFTGVNQKTKNTMHIPQHAFSSNPKSFSFVLNGTQNQELITSFLESNGLLSQKETLMLSAAIDDSCVDIEETTTYIDDSMVYLEKCESEDLEVMGIEPFRKPGKTKISRKAKFTEPTQEQIDALADF